MRIGRFLSLILLSCSLIFGAPVPKGYWNALESVVIKKDQVAVFDVNIDQKIYQLRFRWTLFVNDGLVMLYDYRGFKNQNILYKGNPLDSFKIELREPKVSSGEKPFALLTFKDFNLTSKQATLEIGFRDSGRQMLITRKQ